MTLGMYEIVSLILSIAILIGIRLMSSPKTALKGNWLSALSMLVAVLLVLYHNQIISSPLLWIAMVLGSVLGYIIAVKVTMIQMPQLVSFLNGFGGGAAALIAIIVLFEGYAQMDFFGRISSQLTLIIGCIAFSGSVIAAAKLDRRLPQRPIILKGHNFLNAASLILLGVLLIMGSILQTQAALIISLIILLISLAYGVLFSIRVGGADMPIVISLLITYAGFSNVVLGFAINDVLLVAIGSIVGAAGAILTKLMCEAMNRSLLEILNGASTVKSSSDLHKDKEVISEKEQEEKETPAKPDVHQLLKDSKKVVIVPGYGMALAQVQQGVKRLFDLLESQGKEVIFAIHPVAGRMPGHMNVLLAEVDIPYEQLLEMDEVNPQFKETDVAIIIGACDVVNPEAMTAEGTPIYGMPILRADEAKNVIVLNLDTKPGYSGVDNSLYDRTNVHLLLGNAAETVEGLVAGLTVILGNSELEDKPECA